MFSNRSVRESSILTRTPHMDALSEIERSYFAWVVAAGYLFSFSAPCSRNSERIRSYVLATGEDELPSRYVILLSDLFFEIPFFEIKSDGILYYLLYFF